MTKVRELLDIPDRIRKMDFTVTLTAGVATPAQTIEQYVVTPRRPSSRRPPARTTAAAAHAGVNA